MNKRICFLLISALQVFLCALRASALAPDSGPETPLTISMPSYGIIRLEGDFSAGAGIRLYQREYRSAEAVITDTLIAETAAEKNGKAEIPWNPNNVISVRTVTPDFDYHGSDVTLRALFGTVSDGSTEISSDLFYTECFLETSVINQFYSNFHGSSSCGEASGVIAIQPVYPSAGVEMYERMNVMREYCREGEEHCTGYPLYETVGTHITNTVNRYITEELSGTVLFTDHRTAEKSTEETLIDLLSTGRPAIIEVCYLRGAVTEDYWGLSHWITVNGFFLVGNTYWFRYSDPVTVSYIGISSDLLEKSNKNVSYGSLPYTPDRYIGAFSEPLFSIE